MNRLFRKLGWVLLMMIGAYFNLTGQEVPRKVDLNMVVDFPEPEILVNDLPTKSNEYKFVLLPRTDHYLNYNSDLDSKNSDFNNSSGTPNEQVLEIAWGWLKSL